MKASACNLGFRLPLSVNTCQRPRKLGLFRAMRFVGAMCWLLVGLIASRQSVWKTLPQMNLNSPRSTKFWSPFDGAWFCGVTQWSLRKRIAPHHQQLFLLFHVVKLKNENMLLGALVDWSVKDQTNESSAFPTESPHEPALGGGVCQTPFFSMVCATQDATF